MLNHAAWFFYAEPCRAEKSVQEDKKTQKACGRRQEKQASAGQTELDL